MRFQREVEGPLWLNGLMVAFVEVYDEAGNLFNPPGLRVRVRTGAGDFVAFLVPGSKGTGRCEFAPLVDGQAQYWFRLEDGTGAPQSGWAICDLSQPYVNVGVLRAAWAALRGGQVRQALRALGQLHKSFYVRFREGAAPPPPPDECPDCERKDDLLRAIATTLEGVQEQIRAELGL